ncbi:MAG: UDP-2,3-diacylglucosamine diphosphatase LpxI [Myxococcota bacterium]
MPAPPLGLIAGDGELPRAIARAARANGREVVGVAFPGITDPELEDDVARIAWLSPGQVGSSLAFLTAAGVGEAVMAGKVSKADLVAGQLELDERGRALVGELSDLRDGTVLAALAAALEAEGIDLRPQAELVPQLIAAEGVLGRVDPTPEQLRDVAFGWPIAREIAGLDIGQTVVVCERSVVAVEALEGTDEAIRRAGKLGRSGLCIVKVARPEQDPRFDLPAIGPETLEVAARSGVRVVAVEAGRTVVLDRETVVARADASEIALIGVPAEGLVAAHAGPGPDGETD